jgi:Protein of unknown function (DUF3179)
MKAFRTLKFVVMLFLTACGQLSARDVSPSALPVLTEIPPVSEIPLTSTVLPDEPPPARAESEFKTDFSKHNVPYSEILSGGPPKDGIPALQDPQFVSVSEADAWLKPAEPVILVQVGEDARAYPIQVLIWHEIVNDTVGEEPLVVTFCPLCNTAIAFKRVFHGQILDFGTTGRLRYSNLIMYDRQTESWWQQATGDAIAGEFTGGQLEFYPASMISWQDFKSRHPDGKVLSQETGYSRNYGNNPYFGYDDINQNPFLFSDTTPEQLRPMERVLTVEQNSEAVAYPYEVLREQKAINDTVGGGDIVVLWAEGTTSALDTRTIAEGRDVGAAVAYSRIVDGQSLTFNVINQKILDEQTGSEWNILGQAITGELQGQQLTPIVSINHFWFSWAAFKPQTRIYTP